MHKCACFLHFKCSNNKMEHPIPLLVAVLALLLTFFALFRNRNKSVLPLPPGTTGWPILGENIEFFSMGRKNTPEKFIEERVHKYSSQVFMTSLIGQTVAVLCGQEGNKFIFSNEGNMLHSWWPKTVQNIFSVPAGVSFYEELHKTRLSIRVFLKPEKLNKSTQHMDSLTKLHVLPDLEHNGKVLSGCTLAKKYSFMTACRLFLSIQDQDHVAKLCDPFNRIMTGMMSLHINFPGLPYNRALKAKDYLRDEIMKIIVQRRKETSIDTLIPEDILSYMLMTNDEDRQFVNNDAITAVKMISMFLAHDSVNTVLSFTMKYLAELPNVYNQVLKEQREIAKLKQPGELLNLEDLQKMSYTWNVVNEVMRFAPTLQGTFSEATCDITYAGYSIPKGSKVHWNAFSTHKNPKYFPEPEKFDPSRFEGNGPAPYTFVPFGGGSRICPGMAYARCAILVFLHNLVTRYSWKKLNLDEKTFYDLIPRFACGLPIQLQPHEFVQDC